MVYLVCPKRPNLLTGGYLYNQEVASALERRLPLRYLLLPEQAVLPRIRALASAGHALILDSLLIADPRLPSALSLSPRPGSPAGPRVLLAHFLPSLDPLLARGERDALERVEERALAHMDGAVAPSRFLTGELVRRGMPSEAVGICRPGVAPALIEGDPPERPGGKQRDGRRAAVRLLTVANWTGAKGHLFLLEVLLSLADLRWTWHIVGDTSAEPCFYERFRSRLHGSSVRDRVFVRGALTPAATRAAFADADLLVSGSLMESYGMVFAESLAAGVPVVAGRVGGTPEVVDHRVTGFLCTPGDVEEWRQVLRRLIASPRERAELGERVRAKRPELATWEQTAGCLYGRLRPLLDTLNPENS